MARPRGDGRPGDSRDRAAGHALRGRARGAERRAPAGAGRSALAQRCRDVRLIPQTHKLYGAAPWKRVSGDATGSLGRFSSELSELAEASRRPSRKGWRMGKRPARRRTKKRMSCALVIDGSPPVRHRARRLGDRALRADERQSASRSRAWPRARASPASRSGLVLAARVARKKIVPPRSSRASSSGGSASRSRSAPEAYFDYVAQLQPERGGGGDGRRVAAEAAPARAAGEGHA